MQFSPQLAHFLWKDPNFGKAFFAKSSI